ncbi:MAG: ATP-binding protein [Prevotellaceae bacterium]|jgi:hypothetical protein|nr:ATP-binding protein [Prevotellaceae bacterium]
MKTGVKRLPYGNSNFGNVITEGYAYVDKTQFIELLENEPNKNQFFIRPRKFGKSLFYSTLYHYYDLNKAADFEKFFGNLYIGKHPTPRRNSYVVLKFNFSGINTTGIEDFRFDFNRKIVAAVVDCFTEYSDVIPDAAEKIKEVKSMNSFSGALEAAYTAIKSIRREIFVLVDEYDHFANDLIAMGKLAGEEVYKTMVTANGLVRDFYETLKIGTSEFIDRIFITGISPVMLNDLTSGFNIADNLTLDLKYNEMMGFTQKEVDALMAETGVDPACINVDMGLYYNGYLFHKDGKNRVYNPSMVLYFFNQLLKYGKPPENIVDENLKTDYGRIQRLVQNERNREKLLKIIKNNGIESDIIPQFSIDRMYDDEYFVSLLVYMGLLTIDRVEEGSLRLKIPNYTIQALFWEYIEKLTVSTNEDVVVDLSEQKASLRELAYRGNPHPYIEYVSSNIFKRLSNRDLISFDEKYIKIMLFNGLFQSKLYVPVSEAEVEDGYMDIFLHRSPLLPDVKYEWVWEIKYLKKENEAELKANQHKAIEQLEKYRCSERFANRADVKFASITFIGKDRYEITQIGG